MKSLFVFVVWLVLLGGLYPLYRMLRLPASNTARLLFIAMSLSYVWCLIGVIFPAAIGQHYSDTRFWIIQVNLWGCAALALAAITIHDRKLSALLAGSWAVAVWLYVQTISFVA